MSPTALLEAMRPYQWVKNLLVFAPLLFAHRTGDFSALRAAVVAFASFCTIASAIYLLNDLADRHADAQHPRKRNRPIPSGRLGPRAAAGAAVVLLAVGLGLAAIPAPPDAVVPFAVWPVAYFVLNVGYSLRLKHIAIVDALAIAFGFQLRVHAGSAAIGVPSSGWLLLCTFFFATLLAFAKRRAELSALGGDVATRTSLRGYDTAFLDQALAVTASISLLSYALYTLDPATVEKHGKLLLATVPFVCFGVFRYLWLVRATDAAEDPARLLVRDVPLLVDGMLWLGTVVIAIRAPFLH
ncbi:MAG: decaprenyl-phosphate phosphoribosyltransferase [Planctomycetes bacterium]|nr:decaprenyl-phosphate phosphoribosyltransferase [Planctomycetota bacterium]